MNNKILKSVRLSADIVEMLEIYAKEQKITFTMAIERMLYKSLSEEKIINQDYKLKECIIAKETKELNKEENKKKGLRGCLASLLK